MKQEGFVIWLTGLSGAGKTSIAKELQDVLSVHQHVELLDGDELRRTICRGLGFSEADRREMTDRLGILAAMVERCGGIAIVSSISPYASARNLVRIRCKTFVEVFVDCPMRELVRRDTKGLYRKAAEGELQGLTGVDDPYEAPRRPEVHVRTDIDESPLGSAHPVLSYLAAAGHIPPEFCAGLENAGTGARATPYPPDESPTR